MCQDNEKRSSSMRMHETMRKKENTKDTDLRDV